MTVKPEAATFPIKCTAALTQATANKTGYTQHALPPIKHNDTMQPALKITQDCLLLKTTQGNT